MTRTTDPYPITALRRVAAPLGVREGPAQRVARTSLRGVLRVRSWAWMDLNHRPLPYQGSALTELSYRPVQSDTKNARTSSSVARLPERVKRTPSAPLTLGERDLDATDDVTDQVVQERDEHPQRRPHEREHASDEEEPGEDLRSIDGGRRASVRALIRFHQAPDPLRHRVGDAGGLEHQEDDQQREPEHEHHAEREQERIPEHRDQAEAPDRDLGPPWLTEAVRTLSPAWPDRAAQLHVDDGSVGG